MLNGNLAYLEEEAHFVDRFAAQSDDGWIIISY